MTRRITSRSDRRLRGPQSDASAPWWSRWETWPRKKRGWRQRPHLVAHPLWAEGEKPWPEFVQGWREDQRAERKHRRKRARRQGWRPGR